MLVEIRVLIRTSDERQDAAAVVERNVRRILEAYYPADNLYIERLTAEHAASWR